MLENVEESLVVPIMAKLGLKRYEEVFNVAEIAISEGVNNHLTFALNVDGLHGLNCTELCAMFNFAMWMKGNEV